MLAHMQMESKMPKLSKKKQPNLDPSVSQAVSTVPCSHAAAANQHLPLGFSPRQRRQAPLRDQLCRLDGVQDIVGTAMDVNNASGRKLLQSFVRWAVVVLE